MNWEAIGAVGEILGAIGVIATLGYLAVQIRQNTRSLRTASFQNAGDQFNHLNMMITGDADYAEVWSRALTEPSSLTDIEWQRFSFHLLSYLHVHETLFHGARDGTVAEALWRAEETSLRHVMAQPGAGLWWEGNPFSYTREFRAHIDSLISEGLEPETLQRSMGAPGQAPAVDTTGRLGRPFGKPPQ